MMASETDSLADSFQMPAECARRARCKQSDWQNDDGQDDDGSARGPRPLRVLFVITSMPVGGAETLLVNLVRRLDRKRFEPEICCLKDAGPLGEELAAEMPVHSQMLGSKYDLRVFTRLVRLMKCRQIDAVVTVGAGDKMFWGRLAAWRAGVPVVLSALHSTGWPDCIGKLNRLLTPITDRFIAVANGHGRFLVAKERFPAEKVVVIPNGVDTQRFRPNATARRTIRQQLGIDATAPVFGIVAALRPEKNHLMFLRAAALISQAVPEARFLIVGDGPEREKIDQAMDCEALRERVVLLGNRSDVQDLLAAMDVFVLTSKNEASPVSILEALAVGLPVVATRVGSVAETVAEDATGFLVNEGDTQGIADRCIQLASDQQMAAMLGENGRELVANQWSLEQMVNRYEQLISEVYRSKHGETTRPAVVSPQLATGEPTLSDRAEAKVDGRVRELDGVV